MEIRRPVRTALRCGIASLVLAVSARGADIEVVKSGSEKTGVDLSSFVSGPTAEGRLFLTTLQDDLIQSGWFTITNGAAISAAGRWVADGPRAECMVRHQATGHSYLSRAFFSRGTDVRRTAHEAADAIVKAIVNVPGIASTRIAMIGRADGRKNLYICDADGQNLIRVTDQNAPCLAPNWSPDGRKVVYTSMHNGYPDVYLIDLGSYRRDAISRFPGLNSGADISSDGRRVALTLSKDGNPEIYVIHWPEGRLTRVTQTPRAAEASPSWSPDGSQLVFVSDRGDRPHLYIASAEGGESKQITFQGSENVAPDWGPDGRIVFSSRLGGRYRVCVYDPAKGVIEPLADDGANYEDPSWAPDRRHVVASRSVAFRSQVWILDTLGDPPRRLTSLAGDWYSPAWSPR
jgi:TolB protein